MFSNTVKLSSSLLLGVLCPIIFLTSCTPSASGDSPISNQSDKPVPAKFEQWLSSARQKALKKGLDQHMLDRVFSKIHYNWPTMELDRNQPTTVFTFEEYIKRIPTNFIIEKGKEMKKKHASLLKSVKDRYGVPPGILMALWGLESSFGTKMGNTHILSAIATLAADDRRSALFNEQFFAALDLISSGVMTDDAKGALHGEYGQFQFIPSNVKKFSVDADGDGKADLVHSSEDALVSAANLLHKKGWKESKGYQPKEENFLVLKSWNNSSTYRKAVVYIAAHIDEIKLKDGYQE
ncbi:MAG: lytic murein transglycosylase [Candidatus Liberibacter ctenarytainae]|uniref:Lytic murein transglycosylase n=1 Tax=Candidatus Liberibacter ctenarytainae TaxID=2020335 RepID=A0A937DLF6_9HYPH|nr:lytic murein transglycosylase [Candidatus Liberibacter ctenarytainae]